jgi:hypothetical protein
LDVNVQMVSRIWPHRRITFGHPQENSQLKYPSLRIFSALRTCTSPLFEVRIFLRILKCFMTEGPEFSSQAKDYFSEFWKKKRIDCYSPADGLIRLSIRT